MSNPTSTPIAASLAEHAALFFSTRHVRECVNSLRAGKDDWEFKPNEAHRTRPYPMGFYADDGNLYYAIGWGMHVQMLPWERWLVRRTANALRSIQGQDRATPSGIRRMKA